MDIYGLIHHDHEAIRTLIEKIEALPVAQQETRMALMQQLKQSLFTHNEAKDRAFYASLEQHVAAGRYVARLRQEHQRIMALLERACDNSLPAAHWGEAFGALRDAVFSQIVQEESTIFALAHEVLSPHLAVQLAGIMEELRHQPESEGA